MNLAEMRGRYNTVSTELGTLWKKEDRSDEDESRIDQILAEMNDLGPKIERAVAIEGKLADAGSKRQGTGSSARKIAREERAADPEPDGEPQYRSIGEQFADNDRIRQYREHGGPLPIDASVDAGSFWHREAPEVQYADSGQPIDRRALVYTGALPTDYLQPQYVPGFFRGDDLQGSVRGVLINGQTTSDSITFFRETAFTNNAAAVAQATATTGATGLKPESAITFAQDSADVVTLAHWIPITRQTLQDASQLQTYVEQRLLDGLRLVESDQLLNGDGTGANMTGLRLTTGVQYLDNTATTGYWATNALGSAGTPRENFDRILRGKTVIRSTGRARANFVVLNPADSEVFLMAVNGSNDYYGPGPFSGTGVANLWGLRVVEDENQPEGEALVGDGRMAAVWDRMQAQILIDTIDDQFVRNMLTILAEERLALTVFRPQAFARVELA